MRRSRYHDAESDDTINSLRGDAELEGSERESVVDEDGYKFNSGGVRGSWVDMLVYDWLHSCTAASNQIDIVVDFINHCAAGTSISTSP
jgi:hypothetical protein